MLLPAGTVFLVRKKLSYLIDFHNASRCARYTPDGLTVKYAFKSFPGGTKASPRSGKLFAQGRQESCTNKERKRTALAQNRQTDPSGDKNPELRKAAAMSAAPTLFLTAGGFHAFSSCKKHDSNDEGERPTRYIAPVKQDLEAEPRT